MTFPTIPLYKLCLDLSLSNSVLLELATASLSPLSTFLFVSHGKALTSSPSDPVLPLSSPTPAPLPFYVLCSSLSSCYSPHLYLLPLRANGVLVPLFITLFLLLASSIPPASPRQWSSSSKMSTRLLKFLALAVFCNSSSLVLISTLPVLLQSGHGVAADTTTSRN